MIAKKRSFTFVRTAAAVLAVIGIAWAVGGFGPELYRYVRIRRM